MGGLGDLAHTTALILAVAAFSPACGEEGPLTSTVCAEPCYSGPPSTLGVGECRAGQSICNTHGDYLGCEDVTSSPETCNGLDDDCDGIVDEGVTDRVDGYLVEGRSCGSNRGACTIGLMSCLGGWFQCVGGRQPTEESCNGIDDDCDGIVDNIRPDPCYTGPPESLYDDNCRPGHLECVGGRPECVNEVVPEEAVPEEAPLDVALLIDISGSSTLIRPSIFLTIEAVGLALPDDTRFALISFPGPDRVPFVTMDFVPSADLDFGLLAGEGATEPSWDAMWEVATPGELGLSWRKDAIAVQVVWADERGQSLGSITEQDVVEAVVAAKHRVFIFTSSGSLIPRSYDDIARASGGDLFALSTPDDMIAKLLAAIDREVSRCAS